MKINKFGLALTGFLAVAGINETQAQRQTINKTQQQICEDFSQKKYEIVNNDLPEKIESHEDFITTRIDKIFAIYGKKRALELINQHMLIEINKFRKENGKPPLKLDLELQELSQERAEKLYNENSCEHGKLNDSLQARIQQKRIKGIIGAGENICQGFNTIKDIDNAFKTSEIGHKDLYLKDECNFCGVGIKCSMFYGDNNKTGNTIYIGDHKYHESNKVFRTHCCITIVQKEEIDQEEIPEKEE